MPELPEVETVRGVLRNNVLGKKIVGIEVFYEKMIHGISVEDFKKCLLNESFVEIYRLGKYLYFELSNGMYLISHLRMEGKYYLKNKDFPKEKHEHIIFTFSDDMSLRYDDTRKFGVMEVRNKADLMTTHPLANLGMEANHLTAEYLYPKLQKKAPIKTLLLDQSIVAGIGNIYADEICFMAKINPNRLGLAISHMDCENLAKASIAVINRAIQAGGTTIRSYTSSLGVTGRFQLELNVHTKVGKPCPTCQTPILKIKIGGRGTYFCPNCQKN